MFSWHQAFRISAMINYGDGFRSIIHLAWIFIFKPRENADPICVETYKFKVTSRN